MIRIIAALAGGLFGVAGTMLVAQSPAVFVTGPAWVETDLSYTGGASLPDTRKAGSAIVVVEPGPVGEPATFGTVVDLPDAPTPKQPAIYRLQSVLAQAGCFDGPVDGQWSAVFHERLAHVVMAGEIDLVRLGDLGRISEVLQTAGETVCGETVDTGFNQSELQPEKSVQRAALNTSVSVARHPEVFVRVAEPIGPLRSGVVEEADVMDDLEIVPRSRYRTVLSGPIAPAIDEISQGTVEPASFQAPEAPVNPVPNPVPAAREEVILDVTGHVVSLTEEDSRDVLFDAAATEVSRVVLPVRNLLRTVSVRSAPAPVVVRRVRQRKRARRSTRRKQSTIATKPREAPKKKRVSGWKSPRGAIFGMR